MRNFLIFKIFEVGPYNSFPNVFILRFSSTKLLTLKQYVKPSFLLLYDFVRIVIALKRRLRRLINFTFVRRNTTRKNLPIPAWCVVLHRRVCITLTSNTPLESLGIENEPF